MAIVVGYLRTPEGEAALAAATAVALSRATELVVVTGPPDATDAAFDISPEQQADGLHERLTALELANVVVPFDATADPADVILETARTHAADLIVIGVRRRSPVGKMLLGSTAQRVLLEADCQVLAVKRAPDAG
jgi:nucleotide-binding universal stress UspA family protein